MSGIPEKRYLIAFAIDLAVCIGLAAIYEPKYTKLSDMGDYLLRVADRAEPLIVVSAAVIVVTVEGFSMLAERYKRARYEEGKREGRQEAAEALIRLARERAKDGAIQLSDLEKALEETNQHRADA